MRLALLLLTTAGLTSTTLAAQQLADQDRVVLAIGPAWDAQFTGLQLRTDYHVVRGRWYGLEASVGGRWTPTQALTAPSALYGRGGRFEGMGQVTDLHLEVAASFSPWPRAPLSPYLLMGVAAVQSWTSGRGAYLNPDGSLAQAVPSHSWTRGDIALVTGFGFRLRLGDRPILAEIRRYGATNAFTLGTALRF